MRNDTHSWMEGAAERSIRAFLMTAETLTKDTEALDSEDTDQLHWCWEGIHHVIAAKLATAQLEAHQAANKPASLDDVMKMVQAMQDKMDAMTGGNGATATPAKA